MKKLYRLKSDFTKCGEKTWFFSFVEEERNEDSVIYKESLVSR